MSDKEKILERTRKLLAMAADVASPHEATIAARRARKLMDEYQISVADLKDASGFGFVAVDREYRFFPVWKTFIAVGVARVNDCKGSYQTNYKSINHSYSRRLLFQGYEIDVQLAKHMYEYLVATVERLCKEFMMTASPGKYVASLGDGFKKGAGSELQKRLSTIWRDRQGSEVMRAGPHVGTSLVVYKMAAVEAEFGKVQIVSKPVRAHAIAEAHGRAAARDISLDPQLIHTRNDLTRLTRA